MSCWSDATDVAPCFVGRFVTGSVIDVDGGIRRPNSPISMFNRKQANVARLKVQGLIWPCIANGRNMRTPPSRVAAPHRNPQLAMFRRRITNDQRPLIDDVKGFDLQLAVKSRLVAEGL